MIVLTLSIAASYRSPKATSCGEDVVTAVIRALISASSDRTRSAQWTTAPRGFLRNDDND
jgi:hypothetical protein